MTLQELDNKRHRKKHMDIRTAIRKERTTSERKDFLLMLQEVFSDCDTSGDNGAEYNHFGQPEDVSDDEYLFEKYFADIRSEKEILKEYAEWYMSTMVNCINRDQNYIYGTSVDGKITYVTYAAY